MSWKQLIDIALEAAGERRAAASEPPVACPDDGEPLETTTTGQLHCQFCGWTWPR